MGIMDELKSPDIEALLAGDQPVVALLPVGSVEPHGPHLPLGTDTTISIGAARRAIPLLADKGITALIAPAVPYGVTECAAAFAGAVSVPAEALNTYLQAVISGMLRSGIAHVCLVNNHLEPAHHTAVGGAIDGFEPGQVSYACPLKRRWGRTLTPEFKKGECHAGQYESSIVMAETPELVDEAARKALPEVPISLAEQLVAGITDFKEMGLEQAYAGNPAGASSEEGEALLDLLAVMVTTEVCEALQSSNA